MMHRDPLVANLMAQLGVPNLFASAIEHDKVHTFAAFDNHPTHWIVIHLWKGHSDPDSDGLLFEAQPKSGLPRAEMLNRLRIQAAEMGSTEPVRFSQLPSSKRSGTDKAEKLQRNLSSENLT
jgi:hypothetical protein